MKKLSQINEADFREGINWCLSKGLSSHAPLGSSGSDFILYERPRDKEEKNRNRSSQVSLRLYNKVVELLLTDIDGYFLFYGRIHLAHGINSVAKEYYRLFILNKKWIASKVPDRAKTTWI